MSIPNSYLFATALAVFRKRCSHEQRTLCMQGAFSPRSSLRTDTKSFGCKPAGMLTGDVFINQVAFRTANSWETLALRDLQVGPDGIPPIGSKESTRASLIADGLPRGVRRNSMQHVKESPHTQPEQVAGAAGRSHCDNNHHCPRCANKETQLPGMHT